MGGGGVRCHCRVTVAQVGDPYLLVQAGLGRDWGVTLWGWTEADGGREMVQVRWRQRGVAPMPLATLRTERECGDRDDDC